MSSKNNIGDSNPKSEVFQLFREGYQPLQRGHNVTNISSISENPPVGGSGVTNNASNSNSSATNTGSSNSNTNNSGSATSGSKE